MCMAILNLGMTNHDTQMTVHSGTTISMDTDQKSFHLMMNSLLLSLNFLALRLRGILCMIPHFMRFLLQHHTLFLASMNLLRGFLHNFFTFSEYSSFFFSPKSSQVRKIHSSSHFFMEVFHLFFILEEMR